MSTFCVTITIWVVVLCTMRSLGVVLGADEKSWSLLRPPADCENGTCVTGRRGIRSCEGRADGKYQHCDSCKVYVVCRGEAIYKVCPCSPDKVWVDKNKKCGWWSDTCHWSAAAKANLINCDGPPGQGGAEGLKPITCITFDTLSWDGKIAASFNVHLNNFGVVVKPDCGVDGDCGRFRPPARLMMPYFKNNDFFELTLSVWFKRMGAGDMPIIASNTKCSKSSVVITSYSDRSIYVKMRGITEELAGIIPTPSQSGSFHHIVVTFYAHRATQAARARVYYDGDRIASGTVQGKMLPVSYPMMIGASECPVGKFNFFTGLMDSISFVQSELTADDVTRLYQSNGDCIHK